MCEFSSRLIAGLDGELLESEAAALEQHVRNCAECGESIRGFKKVSGLVTAYCDAVLESKSRSVVPKWAPVLGVAASVALMLLLFARANIRTASRAGAAVTPSSATSGDALLHDLPTDVGAGATAAISKASGPAEVKPLGRRVRNHPVVAHARIRSTNTLNAEAKLASAEGAIQIAIPGDAVFPPGAVPAGLEFVGEVSIGADGSPEGLRLQPRLTSFEGGLNQ